MSKYPVASTSDRLAAESEVRRGVRGVVEPDALEPGGPEDDTVNATAATLNAGDSLTGGAGNNLLALLGSGTFRVDQLAAFTGFATITLDNFTGGTANLYLGGGRPVAVTGYGSGAEQLFLGSGAVTFHGGSSYNEIFSASSSDWNVANVIDGSSQAGYYGYLYLDWNGPANATYDLTTNTLSHIGYVFGYQQNLTVKINSADAAGVSNFCPDYAWSTRAIG